MHFVWKSEYDLGVKEVDEQHHKIVDVLNQLNGLVEQGVPDKLVWGRLLDELNDYARYHFRTEDDLMEKSSFPAIAAHQKEHEIFRARIGALTCDTDTGDLNAVDDLLYFLMIWLQNHILIVDRKMCEFLKDQ